MPDERRDRSADWFHSLIWHSNQICRHWNWINTNDHYKSLFFISQEIIIESAILLRNLTHYHSKMIFSSLIKLIRRFNAKWSFFYRLPRFNSPIQIFIIRRQSGFCFYWLRSRAVRMKIIARSSVRRFFFAPSLLSLMIPRLLFLQIRFFSASRSTQCGSALSDVLIFLWDGNPSQIVTTQWDFSFRSGIYSVVLAGMLSFLPMVFLSEGDNFRYKFDIELYWQFIH